MSRGGRVRKNAAANGAACGEVANDAVRGDGAACGAAAVDARGTGDAANKGACGATARGADSKADARGAATANARGGSAVKGMLPKRFWLLAVVLGFLVYCLVGAIAFAILHGQAAGRAENTVEYVKKQSLECEMVNNANVMKSQIRVMQNAAQAARDIEAQQGDASEEALKRDADELHLTSIYVLDPEGYLVSYYQGAGDNFDDFARLLSEDAVLDVVDYAKKTYGTRVSFPDGSYADLACVARLDAPGVVAAVYRTKVEYANRFLLTLQSLLDGYRIANDTSVVVERNGRIVASNTVGHDGAASASPTDDKRVVDEIKNTCLPGEMHLVKGETTYYYGAYGKTRDYSVYTFTKASRLLHYVAVSALVGLMLYALIVALFVTSRRRIEHAHLASMLEQKQQYATQLEQAVKVAERASEAKTEFLQRMSHDLRTPLNGIRGMVEVGNACAGDEARQTECREKIWAASGVLLDLVNEALDITKFESGQVVLEAEAIDCDAVIDDVCNMVERQAHRRKVSIRVERSNIAHPYVKSSALHLRRLLMNVASNAVKYNKFGGEVLIEHRELSCVDGVVTHQVTVKDTGIGMSEEFLGHLFEPFAREEQQLDYQPSGTGLGMAITKELVDLMGGTIACESELGRGTTCVITIPFEVADESEARAYAAACDEQASLAGVNVLLAEDNELNREIAEFVIKGAQGTLCIAENGKEALQLFETNPPGTFDVILMDIMMPIMGGYDAASAIRALPRADAKTVPIVAVSANAFADDRQHSREAGMNAHIAKPLDSKELVRIICSLVGK